jgi:tape measure domain-containing protein
MSENAGAITYSVDIETNKTLAAQQRIDQGFTQLQKGMDKTDTQAQKLGGGMGKLAAAIGAVVAGNALREMAGLVQKFQEMSERVQMATGSQVEFEMVQKRLLATANGTYRSLGEAQELYIRTADSLRSMGYSTAQALDVTDSMSFAFVKNATTAERAERAISALSKSVNKGKVEAEAWETLIAAIPSVINDMADASGKTAAEIRALGAAGDLTAQQLTEGLRKSLEGNTEAAAKMSTNLVDASVRSRTALTTVLVALENQTGGLQMVTDGIIAAANAMQGFGADSEKMASFLDSATTAATALAVVVGARLLSAVTGYTAALVTQAAAAVQATRAADANLRLAQAEATAAANALMQAQATAQASVGLSTQASAATALTAAQTRASAATAALTAAQVTANAAARIGATVMAGLRTAMGFLGGPAGVIFLAAGALAMFATSSTEAKPPVDLLTGSINALGDATLRLQAIQIADKLEELKGLGATAATSGASVEYLQRQLAEFPNSAKADDWRRSLAEQQAAAEGAGTELGNYQKRLTEINAELDRRKTGGATSATGGGAPVLTSGGAGAPKATAAEKTAAREAQAIRDQVEALDIQAKTLGQTAAQVDVYKLKLAGATDEQIRAAQSSQVLIDTYNAQTDAEEKMQRRRDAFGANPEQKIVGSVTPLSGGQFDNQFARYEAERVAEETRYTEQLDRLKLAKEAEVVVVGGYQALEQQMAQTHADRLVQIEQAKSQMLLSSGETMFASLAGGIEAFSGKSSAAYQALFAISKGFAIANAGLNLTSAISQAMADPTALTPAQKFANMAAVASAGGSLLSQLGSASMAGRANGGPVAAGQMYRVNEGGAPEVYNAANGQQYMLPNQRGQVVSNAEASGGGGGITNVISITVGESGTAVNAGSSSADSVALAQAMRAVVVDELERQNRQGGILWSMRNG